MKKYKGFEFVNLGLPSGTMWATCNVGAAFETDHGLYFQWGDTVGHTKDSGYDFPFGYGKEFILRRFAENNSHILPFCQQDLRPTEDAAHTVMGGKWITPSDSDFHELIHHCLYTWMENYKGSGVCGALFTSKVNGNTLFFPAGGNISDGEHYGQGDVCMWTRDYYGGQQADGYDFYGEKPYRFNVGSVIGYGRAIRGIFRFDDKLVNIVKNLTPVKQMNTHNTVDLGLPSGTLWASCNVGATSETDPGLYFQWGDTVGHPKDSGYDFSEKNYTKKGLSAVYDNYPLIVDAAHFYMGEKWEIPISYHFAELRHECEITPIKDYQGSGVDGFLVTSKINGNTLFFPSGGWFEGKKLTHQEVGLYGTKRTYFETDRFKGMDMSIDIYGKARWEFFDRSRCNGHLLRAVTRIKDNK